MMPITCIELRQGGTIRLVALANQVPPFSNDEQQHVSTVAFGDRDNDNGLGNGLRVNKYRDGVDLPDKIVNVLT